MTTLTISRDDDLEMPPRINVWRRFLRVFLSRKVVIFGAIIIAILIVVAAFAELIAP
jgi:hypothetical protein